ncbi:MAG: hypothetical protein LLG20_24580 [Acidobacteriales bacterium]|nr:hypothetical protein [Terriglobales bacterium]
MAEQPGCEEMLVQFNHLMEELLGEGLHRSVFERWEMDLLLDIESCRLSRSNWDRVLRRYKRAVERGMRKGARTPLKLSEYLGMSKARRLKRKPAATERPEDLDFKTGTH